MFTSNNSFNFSTPITQTQNAFGGGNQQSLNLGYNIPLDIGHGNRYRPPMAGGAMPTVSGYGYDSSGGNGYTQAPGLPGGGGGYPAAGGYPSQGSYPGTGYPGSGYGPGGFTPITQPVYIQPDMRPYQQTINNLLNVINSFNQQQMAPPPPPQRPGKQGGSLLRLIMLLLLCKQKQGASDESCPLKKPCPNRIIPYDDAAEDGVVSGEQAEDVEPQ